MSIVPAAIREVMGLPFLCEGDQDMLGRNGEIFIPIALSNVAIRRLCSSSLRNSRLISGVDSTYSVKIPLSRVPLSSQHEMYSCTPLTATHVFLNHI